MITVKEEFLGSVKTKLAIKLGGYEVLALWLALKGYADGSLTGGFVPEEVIDDLPGVPKNWRKVMPALVGCGKPKPDGTRGAGLVEQVNLGWQLHDYIDHASPIGREEERREKERERKRNWRSGQKTGHVPGQHAGQSHSTETGQRAGQETGQSRGHSPAGAGRAPTPAADPSPAQPKVLSETTTQGPDRSEPAASGVVVVAAAVPPDPEGKIRCPTDLELLEVQCATLEMNPGIPRWALASMTGQLRAQFVGNPNLEMPISGWRSYLTKAICRAWSDPAQRPKKPEPGNGSSGVIQLEDYGIEA